MVKLKINNTEIEVAEGTTILEATKSAGMSIPSLCYLKGINEIGACRVCVVEMKGKEKLITACNNIVAEGMDISTNSPRVREARRTNVELILSQHDCNCPTCVRSGNCELQTLANNLNFPENHYKLEVLHSNWPKDFPLIREEGKCIKCMRCVQVCDKIQDQHVWDIAQTGSRTTVDVSLNRDIKDADCSLCGQCITHCPTGALHERDDVGKILRMNGVLNDPDTITIIQVAPSVRTAWGEALGLPREFATVKRLVSALRKMGFDYIFDTDFSADLTIMEEGSEFLERLKSGKKSVYPMFTSCCPGWVRFLKSQYPDMVDSLSTAKSPQQMFGAVAKSYYADILGVDPSKICCISVMPCVAKKHECDIPNINDSGAEKDVDFVWTTREVVRLIKSEHIDVSSLEDEEFDMPLGTGSGAGVIFGATGGVMEAALRTTYYLVMGENPDADLFKNIRGMEGIKESTIDLNGTSLNLAIASGLGNARQLIESIRSGEKKYDFVEVMACPGGCAAGGGQPIHAGEEFGEERCGVLYNLDKNNSIRFSHENPSIADIYTNYLEKPLSHKSHKLLHTDHHDWKMPKSVR
ncbi:NADH-dependent [FeFe] hydrogenase, group A6 [Metaclostridioides mangenotii]|uniref:NADH-dependent [FeFe] hydrogenase, group A6 n=1 Tax=Metaclostridioides mangenotii TaxID=1540 RepID=UPI000466EC01|nr:NADH-dependent [FeFe] hydrogenase, group A6 [Clostridioides mangenotii]